MVIEFYGLPGIGKTTIAKQLAASAGYKIVAINSRRELVWYNILFLIKHPVRFFVLFYYLIRYFRGPGSNWRLFYLKFMNIFLHHNAKYEKAKKYQRAIIDQGYFQNIISLFERKVSDQTIKKYINYFIFPDILFVFTLNFKKREERLTKRKYQIREGYGKHYQKEWFRVIEYNNQILLKCLDKISVKYFMVRTDQPINKVVKQISENLNSL